MGEGRGGAEQYALLVASLYARRSRPVTKRSGRLEHRPRLLFSVLRAELISRFSRNRKVRCDGAKPVCFNCSKRDPAVEACDYDAAPKRRGQDKVPGSRTRSAVGQRAPRRAQVADNLEDSGQHPAHGHSPRVNLEVSIATSS